MHPGPSSTVGTIRNSPENTAEETLCVRWRDRHDVSAAHQLAKRYRRLVAELAEIYRPSGLPWNDLIGEGQLGLMRAICRFDPDQGVGLATYATWWIIVSLQSYIQKNLPRAFGRAGVSASRRQSNDVGRIQRSLVPAMPVPYIAASGRRIAISVPQVR